MSQKCGTGETKLITVSGISNGQNYVLYNVHPSGSRIGQHPVQRRAGSPLSREGFKFIIWSSQGAKTNQPRQRQDRVSSARGYGGYGARG